MDGWATRTMSSLFIGGEKLEVVGHWAAVLSERPVHLEGAFDHGIRVPG